MIQVDRTLRLAKLKRVAGNTVQDRTSGFLTDPKLFKFIAIGRRSIPETRQICNDFASLMRPLTTIPYINGLAHPFCSVRVSCLPKADITCGAALRQRIGVLRPCSGLDGAPPTQ